jgi:hypothetical protein
MTTGAPVDYAPRRAQMPSYPLMRDGICSQHEYRRALTVDLRSYLSQPPCAQIVGALL